MAGRLRSSFVVLPITKHGYKRAGHYWVPQARPQAEPVEVQRTVHSRTKMRQVEARIADLRHCIVEDWQTEPLQHLLGAIAATNQTCARMSCERVVDIFANSGRP